MTLKADGFYLWIFPKGIDNGQTVRMAVGIKEILITFRVSLFVPSVELLIEMCCHNAYCISTVQVQESPVFRRDGVNIHSDVFISIAQAILGGSVTAQGLNETLTFTVSIKRAAEVEHQTPLHFLFATLLPCRQGNNLLSAVAAF